MALKDWKVKRKTDNYTILMNEKIGETVALLKGNDKHNKKVKKYMEKN
jgi:hypothetical protein